MNLWLIYLLNAALVFLLFRALWRGATAGPGMALRAALSAGLLLIDLSVVLWFSCSVASLAYSSVLVAIASLPLPDVPLRSLHRTLGPFKPWVYLCSLFTVSALTHLYLPITTFLTSPGELGVHLDRLLTTNLSHTMVVVIVGAVLYAVAPSPRMRTLLAVAAFTVSLLGLLYAYVLPLGYPRMNGLMFEQIPISGMELALRSALDVLVVAFMGGLGLLVLLRTSTRRVVGALVLINVSLALAAGLSVARSANAYAARAEQSGDDGALIHLSRTNDNVLVIMLDRFMGGFVEKILEQEPSLAQVYQGFTWYPRTMAAGENSIAGIHPILGGYDYTPSAMNARALPLRDVSNEAFQLLPLNFAKAGWRVSFVNPRGLGFTMEGDCTVLELEGVRCGHIPASVPRALAERYGVPLQVLAESSYSDLLVLLGAMRGAPYLMKDVLRQRGPWRPFMDHSAGSTFIQWAELKSFPALTSTSSSERNFNFVFNILAHEPYFMGEDCVPHPTPIDATEAESQRRGYSSTFEYQHAVAARCALKLVGDYLEWLKSQGVYDNTRIVVVSDHGIVGPVEDRSSRAVAGGTTGPMFVRSRSVLFVKERGAQGPLRISEEFLPNAEVPRIVCEEIGGCVNPFLGNRPVTTDGRDRPFTVDIVPWQFTLQEPNAFTILEQHQVTGGDPYDFKGWRFARRR